MSTRDHTQIEELLAVRALGGLDGDDVDALAAALASHGPACAECLRLEAALAETAGRLAFALAPIPVDVRNADRILAIAAAPSADHPTTVPHRGRFGRRWVVAVAAAAIVFAIVAAIAVVRPSTTQSVSASWSQQVVPFQGAAGELAMAYTPGQRGLVLLGRNLPEAGPGHVYEVWSIRGKVAASGGCLTPTDGALTAFVDADANDADLMALTVEPATCPSQPTTTPVYTAQPVAT